MDSLDSPMCLDENKMVEHWNALVAWAGLYETEGERTA